MADIHVYFDMDGVLADFDKGVRELCHREPLVQGHCSPTETDALWDDIRKVPHFYARLEPIAGSVEMVQAVYAELGDRCQILTGVPKPHRGIDNAAEDKAEWVRRFVSPGIQVHTVYRAEKKQFCAGPWDILIDDYDKNIREWQRAGGTGILFVNPQQTMDELRKALDDDTDYFEVTAVVDERKANRNGLSVSRVISSINHAATVFGMPRVNSGDIHTAKYRANMNASMFPASTVRFVNVLHEPWIRRYLSALTVYDTESGKLEDSLTEADYIYNE